VLLTGERQELEDSHAPGHAFGDPFHQGGLLRAGQKPASFTLGRGVDARADVGQKLGRVLDLVEDGRRPDRFQEGPRIAPHPADDVGILEQVVARPREQAPEQGGLARAPGPGQDQCGEARGGGRDGLGEKSRHEFHVTILNCYFRIVNP